MKTRTSFTPRRDALWADYAAGRIDVWTYVQRRKVSPLPNVPAVRIERELPFPSSEADIEAHLAELASLYPEWFK